LVHGPEQAQLQHTCPCGHAGLFGAVGSHCSPGSSLPLPQPGATVVVVVLVVVVVVVVGHAAPGVCGVQTSTSCPRSVLGFVPFTACATSVTTRLPGFLPFFLSFTVIGVASLQPVSLAGAGKVNVPGGRRGDFTFWIPAALHAGAAAVSLRQ
jgi:hypothetical protein